MIRLLLILVLSQWVKHEGLISSPPWEPTIPQSDYYVVKSPNVIYIQWPKTGAARAAQIVTGDMWCEPDIDADLEDR